jgi:hypothetical protein
MYGDTMTKCSTCVYSNEWHKQRQDNCGTCLGNSEGSEEFPLYKLSLYYTKSCSCKDTHIMEEDNERL